MESGRYILDPCPNLRCSIIVLDLSVRSQCKTCMWTALRYRENSLSGCSLWQRCPQSAPRPPQYGTCKVVYCSVYNLENELIYSTVVQSLIDDYSQLTQYSLMHYFVSSSVQWRLAQLNNERASLQQASGHPLRLFGHEKVTEYKHKRLL